MPASRKRTAVNRFTRVVTVGNPREFTNYLNLARQLEKTLDARTRENLRRAIALHAPAVWAHINMLGEYDFSDEKLRDALGIFPP